MVYWGIGAWSIVGECPAMSALLQACPCPGCRQPGDEAERQRHQRLLLVFGRLDEAQRRWFAALEADRRGSGGGQEVAPITGLDPKTIRRGREELAAGLADQPPGRVRPPGAGRPLIEKRPRRNRDAGKAGGTGDGRRPDE